MYKLKRMEVIKQTMSGQLLCVARDFIFEDFLAEAKSKKVFWINYALELGLLIPIKEKYIQAGDFLTEAEEL